VKRFQNLVNITVCVPDHAKHLLCSKGKKTGGEVNLDIFHALEAIYRDNKMAKYFVLPIQTDGHMKNCGRSKM
jgi:hypothetical protein